MPAPEKSSQSIIVKNAVLIGMTPLIPIPFVDDWAKNYFQRRMARELVQLQRMTLSPKVIKALADDREGCLSGCLGMIILYPIKKILRKLAFFLEWQRAANLVTHSYYYGYLLEVALQEGWLQSDDVEQAARVRTAIDHAHKGANTQLLRQVVDRTFQRSRDKVKAAARRLSTSLKSVTTDAGKEKALEQDQPQLDASAQEIAGQLENGIAALPNEHFVNLAQRLKAEYARLQA